MLQNFAHFYRVNFQINNFLMSKIIKKVVNCKAKKLRLALKIKS